MSQTRYLDITLPDGEIVRIAPAARAGSEPTCFRHHIDSFGNGYWFAVELNGSYLAPVLAARLLELDNGEFTCRGKRYRIDEDGVLWGADEGDPDRVRWIALGDFEDIVSAGLVALTPDREGATDSDTAQPGAQDDRIEIRTRNGELYSIESDGCIHRWQGYDWFPHRSITQDLAERIIAGLLRAAPPPTWIAAVSRTLATDQRSTDQPINGSEAP